jgi:hypothetical protein
MANCHDLSTLLQGDCLEGIAVKRKTRTIAVNTVPIQGIVFVEFGAGS